MDFEVDVIRTFVEPVKLRDGTLLGLDWKTLHGMVSTDSGRTWRDSGPLRDASGRVLEGSGKSNGYVVHILRLKTGEIAVKYDVGHSRYDLGGSPRSTSYFTRSADEGQTWSAPVQITPTGTPSHTSWVVEMADGRLVLPNEYAYSQPGEDKRPKFAICTSFNSVDGGRTWQESRDAIWLQNDDGTVLDYCEIPTATETPSGGMLMLARTRYQRMGESHSADGGHAWSPMRLNGLVSSCAEIFLDRVPGSSDIYCIWNQATAEEVAKGYYRARLTSAISRNGGVTWESFRTVAASPGMEEVARIQPAGTPVYTPVPGAVPTEQEMVAPEFHMNRAPRAKVIDGTLYVAYTHRRYRYVNGKQTKLHDAVKLRAVPVEWLWGK
ncbi:MAG: exo-alpha-sialidase [SAR202 cluster bacterium]|nr:exo-alpha-sialidase [SAR202 cluster bacterium]